MEQIKDRLAKLTREMLSDDRDGQMEELAMLKGLQTAWKTYENLTVDVPPEVKKRLDTITKGVLRSSQPSPDESGTYLDEAKRLTAIMQTYSAFGTVEMITEDNRGTVDRKSTKVWDDSNRDDSFTTELVLTEKQHEAMDLMDDDHINKILLLGGSGSGKSWVQAYKIVRDVLRYKAPCLIARDKLVDLNQGMIDQIIPTILSMIAKVNGVERYDTWTIDGLKFVKWSDKKTKLEFATGGYIRFAGLSARDLSESGSDKILSPSWLHVMMEEISELDYGIVEKVITRLRHKVKDADGYEVLNKMLLCENPPSINHWSYRRFIESKRDDDSRMDDKEIARQAWLLMNPQDNIANLGATYIEELSRLTGANRERFYLGAFQDMEQGTILTPMRWTDSMPRATDWERLVIFTDPTPLTTRDHSVYADFKCTVLMGLTHGETYIIDVRLTKGSTTDMFMDIKALWEKSPNQKLTECWIENKGLPSDYKQVRELVSQRYNWHVPIRFDKRKTGDKKQFIEMTLEPVFKAELIFFNEAFRNTERGRQVQFQITKFSRKVNKNVHDDVPDAIAKGDSIMKNRKYRQRASEEAQPIPLSLRTPAYAKI